MRLKSLDGMRAACLNQDYSDPSTDPGNLIWPEDHKSVIVWKGTEQSGGATDIAIETYGQVRSIQMLLGISTYFPSGCFLNCSLF